MDTPGHRGPPDHRHDDQPPLLRGVLHRRPGAGGQPRRRRGQRVQADDAPARARARRHRPAGVEPRPLRAGARAAPTARDPLVRQEIAALETGYRIGRILVVREVLHQAPAGFSAATKCFCTEHEVSASPSSSPEVLGPEAHAVGRRHPRPRSTRPATRSWAERRTSCATSSANASSGSRGSRAERWHGGARTARLRKAGTGRSRPSSARGDGDRPSVPSGITIHPTLLERGTE